jgi:type I site-specific restriction-modification system R (restriction) subunit
MGCGEEEGEEEVVEQSIEDKIKDKGNEIKKLNCELKALSDFGEEGYDRDEKKRIEAELQKLHKKAGDLLNKNGLSSEEAVDYTRKYLNPSMDTTDC